MAPDMETRRDAAMSDTTIRAASALLTAAALAGRVPAQPAAATNAFHAECRRLAEVPSVTERAVAGKDGWYFEKRELRHIGAGKFWGPEAATASRASRPDRRDPLPAILDFNTQLNRLGIELILMPVPCKAFIYADKLSDSVKPGADGRLPRLDTHHQAFLAALREAGVTVIDLAPALLALRDGEDENVYCRTDTHWSGTACERVARLLAEELAERPWMADRPTTRFATEQRAISITGDLAMSLPAEQRPAPETLPLRLVGRKTASVPTPLEPDAHSPILLLADSHGLVFNAGQDMYARGAGLFDQLAHELRVVPELIAVRGSAATPARVSLFRRAQRDPEYLKTKKVVVWFFASREFTETSGWAMVPVTK